MANDILTFKSFAVCHREEDAISAIGTEPILAGCASEKYLSDTVGDNISEYNGIYNELTAVYWLRKHYEEIGSPDYIWVQQYRRRFVPIGKYNYYECNNIDDTALEYIKLDTQICRSIFEAADFAAPYPVKVRSVERQYGNAHNIVDISLAEEIIRELYPDYAKVTEDYFEGEFSYMFNIFAFDRETFFRYADWMFAVLGEFVKRRKSEGRLFISERLTGVFIAKLISEGKKCKHLPVLFVTGGKPKWKTCLRALVARTREGASLKSRIKPLAVKLMPNKVWIAYKRKKFVKP